VGTDTGTGGFATVQPTIAARRRTLLRLTMAGLISLVALGAPIAVAGAGSATYRDCTDTAFAPGADLHRCDLGDSTIIGLDLHGINVARSDLSRVNGGCDPDLPRTNLAGAIAYRAIFVDAKLCDAILSGADLHGSDLTNAALEDASVDGANLSRATLTGAGAAFAPFMDSDLSNAVWRDGFANGATFDGADLHRIDFRGTDLRSSSFVGSDLRYARLDGVDLSDADLTGANLRRATGLASATFANTTCADGTNSDANGGTCVGH
jgi:uncharacterized protein YjbI with pentapeptide repeats